jgi:hypothetical protein
MEKDVLKKIQALTAQAKKKGEQINQKVINIHTVNSLSDNIKSKEQADTFKKMLRLL